MKQQPQRRASDRRAGALGRLMTRWRVLRHHEDYETVILGFTVLLIILYQIYGER